MDKIDLEIYNLVHELAIPPHLRGYQYIKSAVKYIYQNPEALYGMTKDVYPTIAKMYNTTASRVERGIRHAKESSRANDATWIRLLGQDRHMPNNEFLANMVEAIRYGLAAVSIAEVSGV